MYSQVVGRVGSIIQARGLVSALERNSFGTDEISVLFPDGESDSKVRAAMLVHTGRGARGGALVGGAFGVIVGSALGLGIIDASAALPLVASPFIGGLLLGSIGALIGSVVGPAFHRSRSARFGAENAGTILVTHGGHAQPQVDPRGPSALREPWGFGDPDARQGRGVDLTRP